MPHAVTRSGARHRLEPWQADLLEACGRFRSRAQLNRFSDQQIGELLQLGLVTTDAECFERCAARQDAQEPASINDLGILTCASPYMLDRSLDSWNTLIRRQGLNIGVVVVDDSSNAVDARVQRDTAANQARLTGLKIDFIDPPGREIIADEIAKRAGVDRALVQFAVAGRAAPRNGVGGNRNMLALLLQDRVVLSADDDVLASFSPPEPAELDLWITSGEARMSLIPFDSPADLASHVPFDEALNPFDLHARFAGRSVSELVRETKGTGSLFDASADLARRLTECETRVAASASGLAGDCGSDCQAFYTFLGTAAEVRDHLLTSGDRLGRSREVQRRAKFPILCDANSLMTFCYAFDNRLLLPPFFPVGRGEDQAWQALLHHSIPESLIAHLPVAVAHRPEPPREFVDRDYMDPCHEFPANAFIIWAIGRFKARGGKPDLEATGRYLRDLTDDSAEFSALLQSAWNNYVEHHLRLVDASPGMAQSAPPWWRSRLLSIRNTLLGKRADPVPLEYAALPADRAPEAFRADLRQFGKLLEAWPAIREAARSVSDRVREETNGLNP